MLFSTASASKEWVDAQYADCAHVSDAFHCVQSWFVLLALLLSTAQIMIVSQRLGQRNYYTLEHVSTPCCTIVG